MSWGMFLRCTARRKTAAAAEKEEEEGRLKKIIRAGIDT